MGSQSGAAWPTPVITRAAVAEPVLKKVRLVIDNSFLLQHG
jgi:hypothetical protein